MAKRCITYDVTHKKTKIFSSLLTRRLAKSVDDLNSSLAHSTEELWTCKDMCEPKVEMSRAHIFMTRTDPYPSQQTRNQTHTCVAPPKFWPIAGPAHKIALSILPQEWQNKHCWRYFACFTHKVVDHLQGLDVDMWPDIFLFHQHLLLIFATVRSLHEICFCAVTKQIFVAIKIK